MIVYNNEIDFKLEYSEKVSNWISEVIVNEGCEEGEINYIFCSDDSLLKKTLSS